MKKIIVLVTKTLLLVFLTVSVSGCGSKGNATDNSSEDASKSEIKIGFSMGTLQEERWERDRDIFVSTAKELGADVIVQNADNDSQEQVNQVKYLLDQGIDILVIIPQDADKSASLVQMAKKAGKKVISYDRLVKNAGVDMYISFDNVKVGELMARYVVDRDPHGNYVIINGSPTDYNCTMVSQGYNKVLQPYITGGKIKIIKEAWAQDWTYEEALKCVRQVLDQGSSIDGIIAGNDNLAMEAIKGLSERSLAGRVRVVGQDADLGGCQRVVEGTQFMTVYKPIDRIAKAAAEAAVKMASGEQVKANSTIYDGKYDVPYLVLEPTAVTKENIMDTVIHDGFHKIEEVFANVPKSLWPQK